MTTSSATDPEMTPRAEIERSTGRWSIETTFQEMRAYVGWETTRDRTEATVTRVAPCLFGLFAVAALLYERLRSRGHATAEVSWAGKSEPTFSDAITTVRRWLWLDWVFQTMVRGMPFQNSLGHCERPYFRLLPTPWSGEEKGGSRAK
jgi:hypothetical protein